MIMLGILRLIHLGFTSSGVSLAGQPLVKGLALETSG